MKLKLSSEQKVGEKLPEMSRPALYLIHFSSPAFIFFRAVI